MHIVDSSSVTATQPDPGINSLLDAIDQTYLKHLVARIAVPRHRINERTNNIEISNWIEQEFSTYGLNTIRQGKLDNIIASKNGGLENCQVVIGAHYDSVPLSPGADDNGSAVAGMLAVAKALAGKTDKVAFIAFNAEEDGLLGSHDLVNNYLPTIKHDIRLVHILEMIGFASSTPGSQSLPAGLPVTVSDTGDFLAIVANRHSNAYIKSLLQTAASYTPQLDVKALKVFMGMEKLFPHLLRSDHSPFWAQNIPAFMWTDTSEFRNPHYHLPSDLPDTLNYEFLQQVTQLLAAHSLWFVRDQ